MPTPPTLSLLVPTRGRAVQLRRFLNSLAATAARPDAVEVVLVVDEDDPDSRAVRHDLLRLRHVVVPPGRTMGSLNRTAYEASVGNVVMLLNDDVTARTRGWDDRIREVFRSHPDEIVLVHTNDTLLREHLCVFPAVSRTYCELAGGICPTGYLRYRIDDHIEDVFNLLGVLGERRTVYLPDVIFEHANAVEQPNGPPIYLSNPATLARDIPHYEALFPERKELALRLLEHIEDTARVATTAGRRRVLAAIDDPASLRVVERLRVESATCRRTSRDTRVTVAVVTGDSRGERCRLCVDAVEAYTLNFELVVLDHRQPGGCSPGALNRLLQQARTDFVALLHDEAVVGPGWLDGLLASTGAATGVVTPVVQTVGGDVASAGVVFHPDGSGHHSPVFAAPRQAVPVFTFCNPVVLIDRARCRNVRFDETYHRYFCGIDFGLRVWEAGLRVVCTPAARVTSLTNVPLPYGDQLDEDTRSRKRPACRPWRREPASEPLAATGDQLDAALFERDRKTFVGHWTASGRFNHLREEVWHKVPELQHLLDREAEAERLLVRDRDETLQLLKARIDADLVDVAARQSFRAPPEPGQVLRLYQRVRLCFQRRGFFGLVHAVGRRLWRLRLRRPVAIAVVNPTPLTPPSQGGE